MVSKLLQIRKISDLTRMCLLPVLILSIFLSFYLYIDMEKIHNKSQELVQRVIPHVLDTQQSAINLVQLKRNIEIMSTAPDLQRARQAYVDIRTIVNESDLYEKPQLSSKSQDILFEVNRLWKLRLQLDEIRSNVVGSLHFMDTLMYLIYTENPVLFADLSRHSSSYIELYKITAITRDYKAEHRFYYSWLAQRLGQDVPLAPKPKGLDNVVSSSSFNVTSPHAEHEQRVVAAAAAKAAAARISGFDAATAATNTQSSPSALASIQQQGAISDEELLQQANMALTGASTSQQDAQSVGALSPSLAEVVSADNTEDARGARVNNSSSQGSEAVTDAATEAAADSADSAVSSETTTAFPHADINGIEYGDINPSTAAALAAIQADKDREETERAARKAQLPPSYTFGSAVNSTSAPVVLDSDIEAAVASNSQWRHGSNKHALQLLADYKDELKRFVPMWNLYLKIQHVFSYDANSILHEVDELSDNYASNESLSLRSELTEISALASEMKPMVMVTVGFCLGGFWLVIFIFNRYIITPLKNIARILIQFRHTKNINVKDNEAFFAKDHISEIREIIDVLPQIFADFYTIKEKSSVLKQRYDELVAHSKYDALTKVLNRGSLNELIKNVGSNTPANFAVLMIDIDFFKNLNDTMGHQRGDEVLFAVAHTIQGNLAKRDMVFRYGGEEFCVILNEITAINAFRVAKRLCNTIRDLNLINDGVPSKIVTISIGLSIVTTTVGQFRVEEMIAQADKALYLAKRNGRDRVVACPRNMVFANADDEEETVDGAAVAAASTNGNSGSSSSSSSSSANAHEGAADAAATSASASVAPANTSEQDVVLPESYSHEKADGDALAGQSAEEVIARAKSPVSAEVAACAKATAEAVATEAAIAAATIAAAEAANGVHKVKAKADGHNQDDPDSGTESAANADANVEPHRPDENRVNILDDNSAEISFTAAELQAERKFKQQALLQQAFEDAAIDSTNASSNLSALEDDDSDSEQAVRKRARAIARAKIEADVQDKANARRARQRQAAAEENHVVDEGDGLSVYFKATRSSGSHTDHAYDGNSESVKRANHSGSGSKNVQALGQKTPYDQAIAEHEAQQVQAQAKATAKATAKVTTTAKGVHDLPTLVPVHLVANFTNDATAFDEDTSHPAEATKATKDTKDKTEAAMQSTRDTTHSMRDSDEGINDEDRDAYLYSAIYGDKSKVGLGRDPDDPKLNTLYAAQDEADAKVRLVANGDQAEPSPEMLEQELAYLEAITADTQEPAVTAEAAATAVKGSDHNTK